MRYTTITQVAITFGLLSILQVSGS